MSEHVEIEDGQGWSMDDAQANDLIDWYDTWTPDQGIQGLAEARQHLSIQAAKMARTCIALSKKHSSLYAERKTKEATYMLTVEGATVDKRRGQVAQQLEELRMKEAMTSGTLDGVKLYLNKIDKVLDSMATWLRLEDRL